MSRFTNTETFRNLAGGTVALILAFACLAASTGPAMVNPAANSAIVRSA